jgi:hypothetical protein
MNQLQLYTIAMDVIVRDLNEKGTLWFPTRREHLVPNRIHLFYILKNS